MWVSVSHFGNSHDLSSLLYLLWWSVIFDVTTIPVLEHHKLRPYTITNLINKHCLCSECSTDHPFPISLPRLEKVKELLSCVQFFATPWTTACQGPLSMEFSRQEYWSGLLFPSPGDLPNPEIEPVSLPSPALASGFFTTSAPWEAPFRPFSPPVHYSPQDPSQDVGQTSWAPSRTHPS